MRNKRYGRGFAGNGRKHPKPSYFPIVLILCLSVGCGYATAKYVVDPVVNYVPQIEKKVSEKQADKAAEKAREAVGLDGLQIVEQRNMYKVIGKICKSKEDARSQMAELPEGTKGFVTEVYE